MVFSLAKKLNIKEYKKPELINLDDPAFDEIGLGTSTDLAHTCVLACNLPCTTKVAT